MVILAGGLGAGKTTLTQGIGAGLEVRGEVTSPTFVISRVHPAQQPGRPSLVHVDAYRLGGRVELDDLDVDAFIDDAVTVVEWGRAWPSRWRLTGCTCILSVRRLLPGGTSRCWTTRMGRRVG